MAAAFFDTNVLVYAFVQTDPRFEKALACLDRGGAISVQCLNEYTNVALRKYKMPWPQIQDALAAIELLCHPILPVSMGIHRRGLLLCERYKLSIYDSLIIAAALEAKCDTIYSEDMQDGLSVEGLSGHKLRIVNPFKDLT